MAIAILVGRDEEDKKRHEWFIRDWQQSLLALDASLDIRLWPHVGDVNDIELILLWRHPMGTLTQFPQLKAMISLAAGVDHVLSDLKRNPQVPLARVVDPYMANDIVQYVTAYALNYVKRVDHWAEKQKQKTWFKEPPFTFSDQTIGIMGLGFLGSQAAHIFQQMGLNVIGWSNSPKKLTGVQSFYGKEAFFPFLSKTHLLICMLPLTNETRNILDERAFAHLCRGAYLINVGRGDHVVEEDLLKALDTGQLSGACLDVFRHEPLPPHHPFWEHALIRVTPHIASVTNPVTAAPQVLENYRRALVGQPLLHQVSLSKGY
jgi:glyoxylate/hydroxypyruvate reductase